MTTNIKRKSNSGSKVKIWVRSQLSAAFVANILTLLTLWYTVHQSNKNETDNNAELKRIRTRDSIQTYRDSIRTDVLINQLATQSEENKRNRSTDREQLRLFSSQISLLNKSLQSQNKGIIIQNEGLAIQNKSLRADLLAKQSQLIIKVHIGVNGFNNGYTTPILSYSLTNVGNSIAQNIISNYCIVSVDHGDKSRINCINSFEGAYNAVSVKPGEISVVQPLVAVGMPLIKSKEYTKFKEDTFRACFEFVES